MENQLLAIGQRLEYWVRNVKKWSISKFAERMEIDRTNAYKYFHGKLDPLNLSLNLRKEDCDLNWLVSGEETTGNTPIISQEQAEMVGFLDGIGITIEDLRNVYHPTMTLDEFIKHYQLIQQKVKATYPPKTKSPKRTNG